ncbi:MAG: hypothetical protein M3P93_12400, partial [Actinomycetota bacterium]|nr:hypothetical protein [Actinomycetota bacterium]
MSEQRLQTAGAGSPPPADDRTQVLPRLASLAAGAVARPLGAPRMAAETPSTSPSASPAGAAAGGSGPLPQAAEA